MDKKMALKKMKIAIINYETYLKNHEYLIIYNEDDNYQLRKIIFKKENFHHLTGVKLNIKKSAFYDRLLNSKLSLNDFDFDPNGTTCLKLDVIEKYHTLFFTPCNIGYYDANNYVNIKLSTNKIIGKQNISLGLRKEKNYYNPNSLLKQQMGMITHKVYPVICILKKTFDSKEYEYSYLHKDYEKVFIECKLKELEMDLIVK